MKTKRLTALLISVLMILQMFAVTAAAEDTATSGTCGENVTWTLKNGVLTISGTGDMFNYLMAEIRAPWVNLPVTTIEIEDGITSIGDYAFADCSNAISVSIPDSVTKIGECAFVRCSSLMSVSIPSGVKTIEEGTFGASGIETLELSEGIIEIKNSFGNCQNLKTVTLPSSLELLSVDAFVLCSSLTEINVGSECLNYTSKNGVVFDKTESILYMCPGGKSGQYTIPDTVKTIGDSSFYNCAALTSIIIPDTVKTIGDSAFYNCTALTSIMIPDSVETIDKNAFSRCSALETLAIPKNVTSIGDGALSGCTSLNTIVVDEQNTKYCSVNGVLFNQDCSELITYPAAKAGAYVIPDSVTKLKASAFNGCSELTSVSIPDSVSNIESNAFRGCSSLTEIDLPDGITSIENDVFSSCSALKSIEIPNGVIIIGTSAFSGCKSLSSVVIPNSVATIGNSAFSNCDALTSIQIPSGVITIGYNVFGDCDSLVSIMIPGTVKSIGSSAFYSCDSLSSVTIENGVGSIGSWAFRNCIVLTSITIPGSVTMETSLFFGCTNLQTAIFEEGITVLPNQIFWDCESLSKVVLPESLTEIQAYAFAGCRSLKSIVIPTGVTILGNALFSNCTGLETVYFKGNAPITWGKWIDTTVSIYYYEGAASWTSPTWTAPSGNVYNTVMLPHEHHIPTYVPAVDSTCKDPGTAEHWTCGCGKLFSDAACTVETTLKALILPKSDIHVHTETRASVTATAETDGYTGDTWCLDCTTKIADGRVIPAGGGICGDDLIYSLKDGVLTISGTGDMYDYSYQTNAPWYGQTIKSVIISEGVTSIGAYAFSNCGLGDGIQIASTVKSIGAFAFDGAEFSEIEIPEGVEEISSDNVFISNYNLKNISLPSTLKSFSGQTFNIGSRDVNFTLNKQNPYYVMLGNCIYNTECTELVYCCDTECEIVLPESVTKICDFALRRGGKLVNANNNTVIGNFNEFADEITMVIPDGVTEIGSWTEMSNYKTQTLILPNTLNSIGRCTFSNMMALLSLYFEGDAPSLEEGAAGSSDAFLCDDPFVTVFYNEGATGFNVVDGKWTTSQGVTVNAVEIPAGMEFQPIVHVPAADATYEKEGNIEYWYCAIRDKYYANAACTEELETVIIPVLPPVEKPVEIPSTENEETVSVKVNDAVIQGNTVTVKEVDTDALASVFDTPATEPDNGNTETAPAAPANTVTIDVSNVKSEGSAEAEKVQQVTIPATVVETVKTAAEKNNVEDAKIAVHLSTGSIIIDKTTMGVIANKVAEAEEGKTTTVSLVIDDAGDSLNETQESALENVAEDEIVFSKLEIAMKVTKTDEATGDTESEKIHDFEGGTVQLEVPFEIPEGLKANGFTVYYLDEDGNLEPMETQYVDGKITWTTGHFSSYIIMYKEPPKEPIRINVSEIIDDFIDDIRNQLIDTGREILPYEPLYDGTFDLQDAINNAGNWAADSIKNWVVESITSKIKDLKNSFDFTYQTYTNNLKNLYNSVR